MTDQPQNLNMSGVYQLNRHIGRDSRIVSALGGRWSLPAIVMYT
jgi:hypothetical protein